MSTAIVMHVSSYWRSEIARILSEAGLYVTEVTDVISLQNLGDAIYEYHIAVVGFSVLDEGQIATIHHLRGANVPVIVLDAMMNMETTRTLFRDYGIADILSSTNPAEVIAAVQHILNK